MKSAVIDVSVIIKWFADEEDSQKAKALLQFVGTNQVSLILPNFAQLEIINTLKLSKNFSIEEINLKIIDFFNLLPKFVEIDKDYSLEISSLIFTHNLASYDAAFIAVANRWDIPLFTADYKHHLKSISKNIAWLKEWKGKV